MKHNFIKAISFISLFAFFACTEDAIVENTLENEIINKISITGADFKSEDGTRSSVSIGPSGASFTWSENDTIGIFPNKGDQVSFAMSEGAGTQTATFSGGGWALKSSATYSAYYPYDFYNRDMTKIPVSYVGQTQNGNNNTDHIGAYDFMAASAATPSNGTVAFDMQHLGCLVQLNFIFSEQIEIKKLQIKSGTDYPTFIGTGYIDLNSAKKQIRALDNKQSVIDIKLDNFDLNSTEVATIYFMMAPTNLENHIIELIVTEKNDYNRIYKIQGKNFVAGKAYLFSVSNENRYNQPIQFEDSNVKALCLNWDTDYDGELSYEEAAQVNSLGTTFKGNKKISLFKELQYFTNIKSLEYAFYGCANLRYINIPKSVTNMSYAFYGCSSLISAGVPDGVTDLSYTFYNCTSLVKSNVSKVVTNMNYAFYECNSLQGKLLIPNTIKNMDVAFKNCYLVEEVKFEQGSTIKAFPAYKRGNIGNWNKGAFDSCFRGCKSIKTFVIPSSIETIDLSTFYECTSLETLKFDENSNLKEIISRAYDGVNTSYRSPFEDCVSLKNIDASNCSGIKKIGEYTFYSCPIRTVKLGNNEPIYYDSWFNNISDIDLFVPANSIELYQNSENWKNLKFKSYNPL